MSTLVTENGESSRYASASLLHTLQFHGEQFMQSFASGMPSDLQKIARNRQAFYKAEIPFVNSSFENTGESETEEWSGMSSSTCSDPENESNMLAASDKKPEFFIFSETPSAKEKIGQSRTFMSSKVSKLVATTIDKASKSKSEDELERSHSLNDALLQNLVYTQLFNPVNSDGELRPSQKRKAIAGRVLELTGQAKAGKGESVINLTERNRTPRRIRNGMDRKRKEMVAKELRDAKDTGDYHSSIKQLFNASDINMKKSGTRDRGLKLGVGNFSSGVLKLRREDIAAVQGRSANTRGARVKR